MKFCEKCGKEIMDEAKFCSGCGAVIEQVAEENVQELTVNEENTAVEASLQEAEAEQKSETFVAPTIEPTVSSVVNNVKQKINIKMTKKLGIILAAVVVSVIIAVVVIANSVKLSKYEDTLEKAYNNMSYGAEKAESYASLESKVWRNCIHKQASSETDEYTKNDYGVYYSDFNDALQEFYSGEYLTYSIVSQSVNSVNEAMAELKDCPDKFEDEYRALKEMYVAYSDLTDLVVGSSSYSWNTFSEALETAKSNFKTAKSAASLMIE